MLWGARLVRTVGSAGVPCGATQYQVLLHQQCAVQRCIPPHRFSPLAPVMPAGAAAGVGHAGGQLPRRPHPARLLLRLQQDHPGAASGLLACLPAVPAAGARPSPARARCPCCQQRSLPGRSCQAGSPVPVLAINCQRPSPACAVWRGAQRGRRGSQEGGPAGLEAGAAACRPAPWLQQRRRRGREASGRPFDVPCALVPCPVHPPASAAGVLQRPGPHGHRACLGGRQRRRPRPGAGAGAGGGEQAAHRAQRRIPRLLRMLLVSAYTSALKRRPLYFACLCGRRMRDAPPPF